jgi:acyl-CoA dehydrogenase
LLFVNGYWIGAAQPPQGEVIMTQASGIGFALTEEQQMLQNLARDFAREQMIPVAEHYDRTAEFPAPIIEKARQVGLMNANIPSEYGGSGASLIDGCLLAEELGWGCAGIATSMLLNDIAAIPLIVAGSAEQKKLWLGRMLDGQLAAYAVTEPGAGSDVAGIQTTAVRQGDTYVINGSKTFITNASVASFYVVFAHTDRQLKHRGISAFLVERDQPGFSVGKRLDKMGQRASDTAELFLDSVTVPENRRVGREGDGFMIAMQVFDTSRPVVAAMAVGLARRALEESVQYGKTRQAFGAPIGQHQAIGHLLADMAMNVEAARLLAWRAAWAADQGRPNTRLAAFAKAFAADTAMKTATDAVQVFGGSGYIKGSVVEKLMRDAKVFQIYEGTSQIQRNIIARGLLR